MQVLVPALLRLRYICLHLSLFTYIIVALYHLMAGVLRFIKHYLCDVETMKRKKISPAKRHRL